MLNIKFANQDLVIDKNATLAELLKQTKNMPQTFAIAINQSFISKSQYNKTILREGDKIEIITPMQGG